MAIVGKKSRRVLYWIVGSRPTAEQLEEANRIDGQVMFRNAMHMPDEGALEPFDVLAGSAIPARYQAEFDAREKAKEATTAANVIDIKAKPDAASGSNIADTGGKKPVKWPAKPPANAAT